MQIIPFQQSEAVFEYCLTELRSNGLIISPSDTVYGLLCDATNENAVRQLIAWKSRPAGKPISVFVSDLAMASDYVEIDSSQQKILQNILPGPFTMILPSRHKVQTLLESEFGTLGIRIPQFSFLLELAKRFGKPITATSANMAGESPFHNFQSLFRSLSEQKKQIIHLALDAGALPPRKPSTVIDLTKSDMPVLRAGDVALAQKEEYVSQSAEETMKIGEELCSRIKAMVAQKPVVVILKGDLGVGKTVLVKGIAHSLGIESITSPTYVIAAEYPLSNVSPFTTLHHLDLYNIRQSDELRQIGIEAMLKPGNLICIEWGDKAGSLQAVLAGAFCIYGESEYISATERKITLTLPQSL